MATLTSAATATDAFLTVSNPAQNLAQGTLFRIDDEVLAFDRYGGDNRPGHRDYNMWFVYRGQNRSLAAAHAQGATVQAAVDAFLAGTFGDPPGPFDGGVGGDFDIPGLPALPTPDDADELPIVDVSAAQTKKVTVANLRGGSSVDHSTAWETFSQANQTVPDGGANTDLTWSKSGGSDLLDLTDPLRPVIVTAGVYAFNAFVSAPGADSFWFGLDLDINNLDPFADVLVFHDADYTLAPAHVTFYLPAGAVCEAAARNNTGSDITNLVFTCYVQRLT